MELAAWRPRSADAEWSDGYRTAPAGTAVNGGQFVVPDALGNKLVHPSSDFLLHDGLTSTPEEAIARDRGQAAPVTRRYDQPSRTEKEELLAFLSSL